KGVRVIFAARLMARVLGMDFGTKRTGLAVTDPMQIIVNPLAVLPTEEIIPFLEDYFRKEEVELLVCGLPGEKDTGVRQALATFMKEFEKRLPELRIVYQDEQLTSDRASGIIRKSGLKKMQRRDKSLIDQVSAVLILQEYLGHLND